MKNTVTTSLRKAIAEIAPTHPIYTIFSDSRKNKTAVGVKIVGKPFSEIELDAISMLMKKDGWKRINIKYNKGNPAFIHRNHFNGTRFTYYK